MQTFVKKFAEVCVIDVTDVSMLAVYTLRICEKLIDIYLICAMFVSLHVWFVDKINDM